MAKRGRSKKNIDNIGNEINTETKPKRKYTKRKSSINDDNNKNESEDNLNTEIEEEPTNPYTNMDYVLNLKYDWVHPSKIALNKANSELHKNYSTWDELSGDGNLSEDFISKYQNEINWYFLLKKQKDFSEKFIKKFKDHFILLRLGLV